jgi:hypothetical protein
MDPSRNPEYLQAVADVLACLRRALHDDKLSEPTPDQVYEWLQGVTMEDIQAVWLNTIDGKEEPAAD